MKISANKRKNKIQQKIAERGKINITHKYMPVHFPDLGLEMVSTVFKLHSSVLGHEESVFH